MKRLSGHWKKKNTAQQQGSASQSNTASLTYMMWAWTKLTMQYWSLCQTGVMLSIPILNLSTSSPTLVLPFRINIKYCRLQKQRQIKQDGQGLGLRAKKAKQRTSNYHIAISCAQSSMASSTWYVQISVCRLDTRLVIHKIKSRINIHV